MKNIIFIDWDDTLFPTTWIHNNNINCINKEDINKYKLFFLELYLVSCIEVFKLLKITQKIKETNEN